MKALYLFSFIGLIIFLGISLRIYLPFDFPDWMIFYLNDFLCMPIVLTICLKVVHLLKKDSSIRLSLFTIFSLTALYAVYFEFIMPHLHSRYTADVLDVVMYFMGGGFFYFLQHRD